MNFTITIAIIAITTLISIGGFYNQKIKEDLIFYPPSISQDNQWYRFFTCGLIHADVSHLFFNMYGLYMFGNLVEPEFSDLSLFGENGKLIYIILYVTALLACLLPTYFKHKNNASYSSLGASGAVSAIVFAFMFLNPTAEMGLILIPGRLPSFLFGIIYLIITTYLARRGGSHINHSAHLWGSVYGLFFLIVTSYTLSSYDVIGNFTNQVTDYFQSF